MGRNVLGVVVGLVAWMAVFYGCAFVLANLWPEYENTLRTWVEQRVYTFTVAMAVCNLLFFVVAEYVAGAVVIRIARHTHAMWIMALLIWAWGMAIHVVLEWSRFPWWYNLGVVIPVIPAVWLGSRWSGGAARPAISPAASL